MKIYNFGMSDWLLFHTNSVIIQLNHGEHKYNFQWDDGEIRFLLDKHASWIFVVPAQWNNRPRIDMSLHSDTLSGFQANQLDPTGTRTQDVPHSMQEC